MGCHSIMSDSWALESSIGDDDDSNQAVLRERASELAE